MNKGERICGRSKSGFVAALATCGAIAGMLASGCATIIHGTHQDVGISSAPTGAEVWVDNIKMGETPVVTKLRRKDAHVVKLVLPGYEPYETTITRSVSGWLWGNIVIGGFIGLGVDAISGGMYRLSPAHVSGSFAGERSAGLANRDEIYIDIAMTPKRGWDLVGQLQKSNGE
jgi:hypothetical protein